MEMGEEQWKSGVGELLRRSFVGTFLPLLIFCLSVHANHLYLATPTLPYVVSLARHMDKLNRFDSGRCLSSIRALRDSEASALSHMPGASGKSNHEVKAFFSSTHKSNDVRVDGDTMRSSSSTNQHIVAEPGCKRGRAYWEFKLVSDSDLDEVRADSEAFR